MATTVTTWETIYVNAAKALAKEVINIIPVFDVNQGSASVNHGATSEIFDELAKAKSNIYTQYNVKYFPKEYWMRFRKLVILTRNFNYKNYGYYEESWKINKELYKYI